MQIREAIIYTKKELIKSNIDSTELEATILLCYVLNMDKLNLYKNLEKELNEKEIKLLNEVIERRKMREPIQYITKNVNFYGLDFFISQPVFIPRPETELLVEEVIKLAKNKKIKLIEIGTGSGVIAITIAKFLPNAEIFATDIISLFVAKCNAIMHNVNIHFIRTNLFTGIKGKFDFIVSNPPYIPENEIEKLEPEIKFENRIALSGGEDGLFFIRSIITEAKKYLVEGGKIVLEILPEKAKHIEVYAKRYFTKINFIHDLTGAPRIFLAE